MFLVMPEVWVEEFLFSPKQTVEHKAVKQGVHSARTRDVKKEWVKLTL